MQARGTEGKNGPQNRLSSGSSAPAPGPKKRTAMAAVLLPVMIRLARIMFGYEVEVKTAVLLAWTDLAGIPGWTPEMVRRVEREMQR